MKLVIKFLFVFLFTVNSITNTILQNRFSAFNKMKQEPNRCSGNYQSPINIVHDKNTVNSNDFVKFNYKMPSNIKQSQFFNDGEKLTMNINIGDIEYFNSETDTKDKFEAYKIELHLPSEHYITVEGITKRCALEMQIYHKLTSRENILIKHNYAPINIKQAVVSMLFVTEDSKYGDRFFQEMGITERNINKEGDINIPKPGEFLKGVLFPPASYGYGFDYLAFEGLMNLVGGNRSMYFYYGSNTSPPCKEESVWMVYAEPREISINQLNYLSKIMVKTDKDGFLKGNNREIKLYDVIKRGFIRYNANALRKLGSPSLFQKFLKFK